MTVDCYTQSGRLGGLRCDVDRRRYWLAMGALDAYAAQVAAGETVSFRPTGSSMVPLIRSRQLVTVVPVKSSAVEVGDIVLATGERKRLLAPRFSRR